MMKRMNRFVQGAMVVAAGLMVACSNGKTDSTTADADSENVIRIGSMFELTGAAAEYGISMNDAVKMAVAEINDAVLDGTFTEEKKDAWDEKLATVFNRGFWDGYYQGQTLGEWNKHYGSVATEKKVLVGKVMKYSPM